MTNLSHSSAGDALDVIVQRQCRRVVQLMIVAEMTLIISTWPLWWGSTLFPMVSVVHLPVPHSVILWGSRLLLIVFGVCLATVFRQMSVARRSSWQLAVLLLAGALTALNQHRMQPWHWLFLLTMGQFLLLSGHSLRYSLRLTIVSIYIFSALSRITSDASLSMSEPIVRALINIAFPGGHQGNAESVRLLGKGLIVGELLVGAFLLIPRFRKVGIIGAITMHILLVIAFSPIGLNHHPGVVVWNMFLAVIVGLLFRDPGHSVASSSNPNSGEPRMYIMAAAVILFPLSGLFAVADNWPSWQVYSPRPERVTLLIHESAVTALPEHIRRHLGRPSALSEWRPLRMDRWSLEAVRAPLYPEDRFQFAVVHSVVQRIPDGRFRVEVNQPDFPDWWNRNSFEINSEDELNRHRSRFLIPSYSLSGVMPPGN